MLKTYMAYSREGGPQEGAFLVFAHNSQEAKRISWDEVRDLICDEYIDVAIKLLKEPALYKDADQEKLAKDIPHVVDNPTSCSHCDTWGSELSEEGLCESCIEEMEDIAQVGEGK